MSPLQKAIQICGSQSELARRIGGNVKTGHIYYWLKHGVPPGYCVAVERATGALVTRYELFPELSNSDPKAKPKKAAA